MIARNTSASVLCSGDYISVPFADDVEVSMRLEAAGAVAAV